MSLSSIGAYASTTTIPLSTLRATTNTSWPADSTATTATQPPTASPFASALDDAFATLGLSFGASTGTLSGTTGASTATSADGTDTTSAGDAVSAFMQSLFAALHSQSAGPAAPPPDGAGGPPAPIDASASSSNVGPAHRHGGKLESDLQSLIAQLDASTTAETGTTDGATSSMGTTTPDTPVATLGKTFDALLATTGQSATGSDALQSFLQTLADRLHGAPAIGAVVSTTA